MVADLVGVLRRTALLASVPDAGLAVLAGAARTRSLRRGQVVCTAGDPGDTLIVVISGRLKVVTRSADGAELTLTTAAVTEATAIAVKLGCRPLLDRAASLAPAGMPVAD